MVAIRENIERIRNEIRDAEISCGRRPGEVRLVAVTKTRPINDIIEAVRCGIEMVGENRVQELVEKVGTWPQDLPVQWRLIGHLQRNKARKAVQAASAVDSVDSLELAAFLSKLAGEGGKKLPVLLEINTSGEGSKNGIAPGETEKFLEEILKACPFLSVEGFMTIGPLGGDESKVRKAFSLLRSLCGKARDSFTLPLPVLSMGMSGDFRWAVQEGSTMVRIGSALFGDRTYK
ncbi:MAG: YggS family pyridoxal phosphate-dependent enzyme [Synergistaceae bacterium]|nr:YggS family pyridoxal phosphate-dependent enzyme [Synergistaceae bacterium]MDD4611495.1 YggS family pyridoxal phosphate-dependent enzyme [Synergistaceae bacterium]